jgi:hypothetical protein
MAPVTNEDWSEARKSTAWATSSGEAQRPRAEASGWVLVMDLFVTVVVVVVVVERVVMVEVMIGGFVSQKGKRNV